MKTIFGKILFLFFIFVAAFSVWYSPVLFKGYTPYKMTEIMPIAKNLSQTGKFSMEDKQSVLLPTSLIKEKGENATSGNKLTVYLYAWIFKVVGVLNPHQLVVAAILLNSLSLAVFAFTVLRLFGFGVAGLFAAIYIFMPYNWESVYSLGTYEFAIFFFSIFFLFFLLGRKAKREALFMSLAGAFLSLSALSREVFFLMLPIMAAFLWFNNKSSSNQNDLSLCGKMWNKKRLIYLFVPVILILSVFYFPGFFSGGENNYSGFFSGSEKQKPMDSPFYEHLFPDPYTYHFEREKFLADFDKKIENSGFVESLESKKILANLGIRSMGIIDRLSLGVILLFTHLSRFISLEFVAGPFVLMFALLGLYSLREKDKNFYRFSIYWFLGTMLLLSFVVVASRSHLRDFNWIIPVLASLGIFFFADILKDNLKLSKRQSIMFLSVMSFLFVYNLILADHVVFGKVYDGNPSRKLEAYAQEIKKMVVKDGEVIAVGLNPKEEIILSYLADKSMVIFAPKTIIKLSEEGKIAEAFKKFNVKYILGYNSELASWIEKDTSVKNLTSSNVKLTDSKTSPLKSFFMGVVR